MRLLIVAMSDSVHTARWIAQIADQGWDIRLFPSMDGGMLYPGLRDASVYHSLSAGRHGMEKKLRLQRNRLFSMARVFAGVRLLPLLLPNRRARQLQCVISEFRPDIIHSMEIQAAGYLTLEAKKKLGHEFPPWIVTNWGSDIYYFGRFPEHGQRIRKVLANCDYYTCECQRDIALAGDFGFKGRAFPVSPNAGGFDLNTATGYRSQGLVSERRIIMLKGYQHWVGRAIVGLRALGLCREMLKGYDIVIHSATPDVMRAAKRLQRETGINVHGLPKGTSHEDILRMYGQSRISIGLSMSDGISTSFLEGLVMGAFPVQSWTACADEWIEDGKTGLLVPPEDPEGVASALRKALTDDDLVNSAAEKNYLVAAERLDQNLLKPRAVGIYAAIAKERGIMNGA